MGSNPRNVADAHEHQPPTMMPGSDILGHRGSPGQVKVKKYDFKRPDKFSKEQIRTLSIMHETFARLIASSLSASLRLQVEAHVAAVDQLTYEEFIRSIPNPTFMGIVHMDPLKVHTLLEIDPDPVLAAIDRLFGGQGEVYGGAREFSETERAIMSGLCERLLKALGESWSPVLPLHPRLGQIETNPQFAQIVPPTEMTVLVSLDIRIGDVAGMLNLCIPYLTIEPIISKLSARYMYSRNRRGRPDPPVTPPGYAADLPVETRLCLDAGTMSLAELGALQPGTLIPLAGWDEGEALLRAGGRDPVPLSRFMGAAGRAKDHPLLILRRASKGRRPLVFTVETDAFAAVEELLYAGGARKERNRDLAEEISAPVRELAEELREGLAKIGKRLDEFGRRQDEISDQVLMPDGEPGASGAVSRGPHARPFDFVSSSDAENLGMILKSEHPQLSALVLSCLEPSVSSQVLCSLPDELKIQVTERIYAMDRTAPAVLRVVERVMENRLAQMGFAEYSRAGGYAAVVDILNVSPRMVEKTVIEALETRNPDVAEDIKRHMFVFEDVVLLDRKAMTLVIGRASRDDVVLALKAVVPEVREYVLAAAADISAREEIEAAVAELGPVRLSDVEAAQQRIVFVIRTLEEEGYVHVARQGEDDLVD